MRVAIIVNGIVVNVCESDTLDSDMIQSDTANIGDSLVNGVVVPKVAPITAEQSNIPNPNGFIQAVKVGMGGIVASNKLSAAYPLFFSTVLEANWADTQALILDAKANNVINATQYAAIQAAAVQYNIPLIFP